MNEKTYFLVLPILLFQLVFSFAQDSSILWQDIQSHKQEGVEFEKKDLFSFNEVLNETNTEGFVKDGAKLDINWAVLQHITQNRPVAIRMKISLNATESVWLSARQYQPVTTDFGAFSSENERTEIPYAHGVHYRGIIEGSSRSLVAISFFEDNVMAVMASKEFGNMVLGKMTAQKGLHFAVYKAKDLLVQSTSQECKVLSHSQALMNQVNDLYRTPTTELLDANNCVRIYYEIDYDFFVAKGSSTENVIDFMVGAHNAVATIYTNEAVKTEISEIFIHTSPDSYNTTDQGDLLVDFRTTRTVYNGDLAHFVYTGDPAGGGIAYLDVICSNFDYGVSKVDLTFNDYPTYNWTVNVLTHELGHNMGSNHTHACVWNGNNTAIDGCGPTYDAGLAEGACATGPLPASGTVMSYCHLLGAVGVDLSLGFGPQPGAVIRDRVYNANCLSACNQCPTFSILGTPEDCVGNLGSVRVGYASAGDSGNITYAWSNGSNTSEITGLSAGTYTVTVSGDGGCATSKTFVVNDYSSNTAEINIAITFDNYPSETSWVIQNGAGSTVASSPSYATMIAGSSINETVCLPDDCYTFTIFDSYADGICCGFGNGSYTVTDVTAGGTIIATGGSFTDSESTSNICLDNLLPVELIYFKGESNLRGNLLSWVTATEIENDFFHLERSYDGIDFEVITKIQGNGNSTESHFYQFLDQQPRIGINYYRLSQFDFDGDQSYVGDIIALEYTNGEFVQVYPKPTTNFLNISYFGKARGPLDIRLFDAAGKRLKSYHFEVEAGINEMQLSIVDFPSGIYFLQINDQKESSYERIMKLE